MDGSVNNSTKNRIDYMKGYLSRYTKVYRRRMTGFVIIIYLQYISVQAEDLKFS